MTTTKPAIAIDLDQLQALMAEFIATHFGPMADERYDYEYRFEIFLQWLVRKRQETTNGKNTG